MSQTDEPIRPLAHRSAWHWKRLAVQGSDANRIRWVLLVFPGACSSLRITRSFWQLATCLLTISLESRWRLDTKTNKCDAQEDFYESAQVREFAHLDFDDVGRSAHQSRGGSSRQGGGAFSV
jgi:hypothetical protein